MIDIPKAITDEIDLIFLESEAGLHAQGAIPPTLLFRSPFTPKTAAVPTEFESAQHRRTIIQVARMVGLAHRADRVFWVCEAWVDEYELEDGVTDTAAALAATENMEPTGRSEVVIVIAVWRSAENTLRLIVRKREIQRHPGGVFKRLGVMVDDYDNPASWLGTLLTPTDMGDDWSVRAIEHLDQIGITPGSYLLADETPQ